MKFRKTSHCISSKTLATEVNFPFTVSVDITVALNEAQLQQNESRVCTNNLWKTTEALFPPAFKNNASDSHQQRFLGWGTFSHWSALTNQGTTQLTWWSHFRVSSIKKKCFQLKSDDLSRYSKPSLHSQDILDDIKFHYGDDSLELLVLGSYNSAFQPFKLFICSQSCGIQTDIKAFSTRGLYIHLPLQWREDRCALFCPISLPIIPQ